VINDELYSRDLPDGRTVSVVSLTYGRARICLGHGSFYDDGY
jgi:hypothetical protein